jgi:ADP-heptose:LPS heptosyltransferase
MFLGAAAKWMKGATLLCIDAVLKWTPKGEPRPDRVLIVRLDAIGDFVLWLDAVQALVDHYKALGKGAVLVADATWATWARELAIFEEIIPVDIRKFQRSLLYRYRAGRRIRKLGCTIAVDPTYSRHWLLGDSVIRISGAAERIGSVGNISNLTAWQKRVTDHWYTRLLPADPSPCMELKRNAEFMRGLGEIDFRARVPQLNAKSLRIDDAFTLAIADRPYYVLFPGASWHGKRWPISSFVEVAGKLHERTGWQGVVCGGPFDLELANTLCKLSIAPLLNWAGRTDLSQLAAIFSAARLVLTNDTSAVHIGAASGVPTVCLLGGGQYGRFMPYQVEQMTDRPLPQAVIHSMPCFGCNWHCIYERAPEDPAPCVERIKVEDAWHAISNALKFPE